MMQRASVRGTEMSFLLTSLSWCKAVKCELRLFAQCGNDFYSALPRWCIMGIMEHMWTLTRHCIWKWVGCNRSVLDLGRIVPSALEQRLAAVQMCGFWGLPSRLVQEQFPTALFLVEPGHCVFRLLVLSLCQNDHLWKDCIVCWQSPLCAHFVSHERILRLNIFQTAAWCCILVNNKYKHTNLS